MNQVDAAANACMDFLISQMQQQQHIDEFLKSCTQMAWAVR
ncbi:MAG: TnpV protein [Lachnospiraceae bacterium]|nr:TnpV protein [Lachnospiraceae bacterium]